METNAAGASPVEGMVRPKLANVVPGVVHCARCKFRLVRTNLNVHSGTTSAGNSETEPCPNGCGPLWPVSWEQEAREAWKTTEQFFERAMTAEAELKTLRQVVGLSYGHLWMVNYEPGTPRRCPPERAAYEARKLLRDTMTHEQRGEFINRVIAQVPDLGA